MSGPVLERRVRDQLGFYSSCLAALESTPEAARHVRAETERVLVAPWADRRGQWLGAAVATAIENHLSPPVAVRLDRMIFDKPNLQQTVEFFAFVLLRLGVGISAARYVMNGEAVRLAHRTSALVAAAATADPPYAGPQVRWPTCQSSPRSC